MITKRQKEYIDIIKINQPISIKELELILNKDRTTIQKVLTTLLNKGHISRLKHICDRGFKYLYIISEY